MPILICSTKYNGCGFIGHNSEFESVGEGDSNLCPGCGRDTTFQLTEKNLDRLTNDDNRELGRRLITNDPSVVAIANCGCVHHAEEGVPCCHDVAKAREQFFKVATG